MPMAPRPRTPYLSGDGPWTGGALIRTAGVGFAALAGVLSSWAGVSSQTAFRDQLPWTLVGLAAIGLAGYAATSWIAQGSRAVRAEHRALRQRLVLMLPTAEDAAPRTAVSWVTAPGMSRAHRPECQLVQGKELVAAPSTAPRCGMCAT